MTQEEIENKLNDLSLKKYPILQIDGLNTRARKEGKRKVFFDRQLANLKQYDLLIQEVMLVEIENKLVVINNIGGCGC